MNYKNIFFDFLNSKLHKCLKGKDIQIELVYYVICASVKTYQLYSDNPVVSLLVLLGHLYPFLHL